jgi:hypothetical protein
MKIVEPVGGFLKNREREWEWKYRRRENKQKYRRHIVYYRENT